MVMSCAAFNCTNRYSKENMENGITFHRFPLKHKELLTKWLQNIKRDKWMPTKFQYICAMHFEPHCFEKGVRTRRKLSSDAVPTIFHFPAHPSKVHKERKANRWCVMDIQNANNTNQKIAHGDHLDDHTMDLDHSYCIPVSNRRTQKLKRKLLQQTDENEVLRKKRVKLMNQHNRRKKTCLFDEVISELQALSDDESQDEGSESSNDDLEKKEKNQTLTDKFDPLLPSVQMLPKNLHLKKSGSNEKEFGVWSTTKIAKGVIFGPYNGIYLDDDDGELDENDYCLKELKDNDIVYFMNNKNNEQADWFQYVNFAYHHEEQNLVILKCGGHVYYETIKDILPDSELLVQFSDDHASERAEEADVSRDSEDETKVIKNPRGRPRKHFSKRVEETKTKELRALTLSVMEQEVLPTQDFQF